MAPTTPNKAALETVKQMVTAGLLSAQEVRELSEELLRAGESSRPAALPTTTSTATLPSPVPTTTNPTASQSRLVVGQQTTTSILPSSLADLSDDSEATGQPAAHRQIVTPRKPRSDQLSSTAQTTPGGSKKFSFSPLSPQELSTPLPSPAKKKEGKGTSKLRGFEDIPKPRLTKRKADEDGAASTRTDSPKKAKEAVKSNTDEQKKKDVKGKGKARANP